jgi:hypothetical protein
MNSWKEAFDPILLGNKANHSQLHYRYFACVSYTRIFLQTINELKKIFTNWENQNSSKLQNSQYAMCHIEIHFWTLQYDLKLILVACKAIDLLFHKRSFPNEIHFGVEYVIFFQLSIYELILNIFVGASANIFILIYKIICTITFYLVYFVFRISCTRNYIYGKLYTWLFRHTISLVFRSGVIIVKCGTACLVSSNKSSKQICQK